MRAFSAGQSLFIWKVRLPFCWGGGEYVCWRKCWRIFFHAEESAGGCSRCGGCVVDGLCMYTLDASCGCAACFDGGSSLGWALGQGSELWPFLESPLVNCFFAFGAAGVGGHGASKGGLTWLMGTETLMMRLALDWDKIKQTKHKTAENSRTITGRIRICEVVSPLEAPCQPTIKEPP